MATDQASGRGRRWAALGAIAAAVGGGLSFATRDDVDVTLLIVSLVGATIVLVVMLIVARWQRAGKIGQSHAVVIVFGLAALCCALGILWAALRGDGA